MHFSVLISSDFTNTLPFSEALVSLFIKRILKLMSSKNPYVLIFDEMTAREAGNTIYGALSLIMVVKISA
jgi:hypothetical protein